MKKVVISLATLAFAASLVSPVFGASTPKGQAQSQTATAKTPAKHHTSKKTNKAAHKAPTSGPQSASK